ncbi:MAG: MerR family transcriptional regulator [Clostridia bacterium]|nr:MerR family transcriptional regulator [Clostridia bacterium]
MRLRIGEFSRFTGCPEQTLRYYGEKGLLNPYRDPNNGYRYYTSLNLIELMQTRLFRKLDASMENIIGMQSGARDGIMEMFSKQRLMLESQINILENKLERLRRLEMRFDHQEHDVHPHSVGGVYRLMLSDESVMSHPATAGIVRQWIDFMPYSHFTIIIPLESLNKASEIMDSQWGIGVIQRYESMLPEKPREPVRYYKKTRCVKAGMYLESPFHIKREELKPFYDYVEADSLNFAGDMYGVLDYADTLNNRFFFSLHVEIC